MMMCNIGFMLHSSWNC